jgi:hypothetical protein
MEVLGIPELTNKQIEELCLTAEKAARDYVYSKVSLRKIDTLDISIEAEGTKPILLNVDVDVTLSPSTKNLDVQKLVDEAVKIAFVSAEKHLRQLPCHSQK